LPGILEKPLDELNKKIRYFQEALIVPISGKQ